MASLRDIRNRINSVKNTRQITRAMKLVAGAKLQRATSAATAARPYQQTLTRVLDRVVRAAGDVEHPLLTQPANDTDVLVVVMAADRGLCGNFNAMILRNTLERIQELEGAGKKVRLFAYGRKAVDFFRKRGYEIEEKHINIDPSEYAGLADKLKDRLVRELDADVFSEAYLAYNAYISTLTQEPQFDRVLPMQLEAAGDEAEAAGPSVEYLYEPGGPEILGHLLPMALRTRLFQAFLETEAGEHAKRMTAMDAATRNASDLIKALTLEYNRARQAAITKELIEIVSGAEAL